MQRTPEPGGPPLLVQRPGDVDRARVDLDDGVKPGSPFFVGVDAIQVEADQAFVGQSSGGDGRLDVRDARGEQIEGSALAVETLDR